MDTDLLSRATAQPILAQIGDAHRFVAANALLPGSAPSSQINQHDALVGTQQRKRLTPDDAADAHRRPPGSAGALANASLPRPHDGDHQSRGVFEGLRRLAPDPSSNFDSTTVPRPIVHFVRNFLIYRHHSGHRAFTTKDVNQAAKVLEQSWNLLYRDAPALVGTASNAARTPQPDSTIARQGHTPIEIVMVRELRRQLQWRPYARSESEIEAAAGLLELNFKTV